MNITSKPAKSISLAAFILSTLFFSISWLIGRWSGFFAVYAVSWLLLSSSLIWVVLLIQFYQRTIAEQEKLDIGQMSTEDEDSTIFQAKQEHVELLAIAQRHLKIFEKWFLPVFSALIAISQVLLGLYLLKAKAALSYDQIETKQPLVCAICMTAIAFVSFLISRYATAMSSQDIRWKPLRAGGSSLLGIAVLCFILGLALAWAQFKVFAILNIIEWIIPALLVVLGIENALNVIFDIYRPRLKQQYCRAAFDSRLLGLINEPGKIFHTAASAMDYQFGFKVSQTWFYKLLEKAILPLIFFAAAILYLLSSVVIVTPNEEAVIEHFGKPVKTIGPGPALKWPWPIDIAYKYPTQKILELSIGFIPKTDEYGNIEHQPLLWGKQHYKVEHMLLVATQQSTSTSTSAVTGAVPVSLIAAAVPVQYKIKDIQAFIYNHNEPEKLLESICYQQLTKFAASAKIETSDTQQADSKESLLGAGKSHAKKILMQNIQQQADQYDLGIEIVFLGLQGIHPPPEVAADYQQVIAAVQKKQALILGAHAVRNNTLSTLAGSVDDANKLYALAAKYQTAKEENDKQQIEELSDTLDQAFADTSGDIFATLRQAKSYAFEKKILAKATGERFASQIEGFKAAPQIYKREQRLIVLEEGLGKIRKFVVVSDKDDTQVFIVDIKEKLTPSLYELSGFEENEQK